MARYVGIGLLLAVFICWGLLPAAKVLGWRVAILSLLQGIGVAIVVAVATILAINPDFFVPYFRGW